MSENDQSGRVEQTVSEATTKLEGAMWRGKPIIEMERSELLDVIWEMIDRQKATIARLQHQRDVLSGRGIAIAGEVTDGENVTFYQPSRRD